MDPLSPPGHVPNPDLIPSPAANQHHGDADLDVTMVHMAHTILHARYGGVLTTQTIALSVLEAVVTCPPQRVNGETLPGTYVGGYLIENARNVPIAIWDAYLYYRSVQNREQIDLRRDHAVEYLTNLIKRGGPLGGTVIGISDKYLGIAPVPGLEKELPLPDNVEALVDFVANVLRLELKTADEIIVFIKGAVEEGETTHLLCAEHVATLNAEGQHRLPDLSGTDVHAAVTVCREVREVFTAIFAVAENAVRRGGGTVLTISSLSLASESVMR
jgi:hypothetical protein